MNDEPQYTHHVPPPCEEAVEILFADEHVVVTSKPSGLLSVPGRFVKDCVVHRVAETCPEVRAVHRLDLDTSGLLVLANSQLAVRDLNRQFRERRVLKRYDARVFGEPPAEGVIDAPLRADWPNRPRQVVDLVAGKPSETRYRRLASHGELSDVELIPITGRSHQLRLHLAHIGHPILGCDLYAHAEALAAAPRLMLHASNLAFSHPESGELLQFSSRPPWFSG